MGWIGSFRAGLVILGLALALAPLGAWVAVRGSFDAEALPVILLAIAFWTWVAGFDLIYACQDADYDRDAGLHSFPARRSSDLACRSIRKRVRPVLPHQTADLHDQQRLPAVSYS